MAGNMEDIPEATEPLPAAKAAHRFAWEGVAALVCAVVATGLSADAWGTRDGCLPALLLPVVPFLSAALVLAFSAVRQRHVRWVSRLLGVIAVVTLVSVPSNIRTFAWFYWWAAYGIWGL